MTKLDKLEAEGKSMIRKYGQDACFIRFAQDELAMTALLRQMDEALSSCVGVCQAFSEISATASICATEGDQLLSAFSAWNEGEK